MNSAALRLRLGTRWRREGTGLPRDRVGLELHGVDLLSGASDELLIPLLTDWLAAFSNACAGAPWTSVDFPGAGWLLCMQRRGEHGLVLHRVSPLSWPGLGTPPAPVELEELRSALDVGVSALLQDLQGLPVTAADLAGLETARIQLRRSWIQPPRSVPAVVWPRAVTAGAAVQLRWDGSEDPGAVRSGDPAALARVSGHLQVLVPGPPLGLDGVPLLPMAHALVDAALRLAEEEEEGVELIPPLGFRYAQGHLSGPGVRERLSPAALARDLFQFGHAAAALLVETHPPCAQMPAVESLLTRTAEALAAPPKPRPLPPVPASTAPTPATTPDGPRLVGRGRALKRLSFVQAWQHAVPGAGLLAPGTGGTVTAAGSSGLWAYAPDGRMRCKQPEADRLAVSAGGECAIVRLGDALLAMDLDGEHPGQVRWIRTPSSLLPRGALLSFGHAWCLLSAGQGACGLSAHTGRELWRLAIRGGAWLVGAGGRAWLSTELGSLLQLHPETGAVGAAVHGQLPHHGPASLHGRRLSAVSGAEDRSELAVLDAASGAVLLRRPLALGQASPALPHDRRWYVAGQRGGEARLLALTPSGRAAWERPLPFPGPWRLVPCAGGILATNRSGAAACVETSGKVRWTSGSAAPDESEQPVSPVVRRGVAFAFGPEVRVLDARTGELLAELPLAAPARAAAVDRTLGVQVLDGAERLTAWRLGTHLSAVRDG